MLPLHSQHRRIPILPKLQLPSSVDHEKTAKHLSHIEQYIAVSLNIIIRVYGQILRSVRHCLNRCPALSQIHITGRRTQHHEIIGVTDGFQRSESLLEPNHVVVGLDLQALCFPVRFRYFKDSHRDPLIGTACYLQVIEQLHLCIFQRVPVNLGE